MRLDSKIKNETNVKSRAMLVSYNMSKKYSILGIEITFPSLYPYQAPPGFNIVVNKTSIPSEKLIESLIYLFYSC